jgi:hypothetical protein
LRKVIHKSTFVTDIGLTRLSSDCTILAETI